MARIEVLHETETSIDSETRLYLQYGIWHMDNGEIHRGYRFMHEYNGRLKPYRGQARIPTRNHSERLWAQADLEGWADLDES